VKYNIIIITNIILILAVCFVAFKQHVLEKKIEEAPKSRNYYFATTEDGRLVSMVPLSDPKIRSKELISWVKEAVLDSFNYNSNDYRRKLNEVSRNYTKRGWESLTTRLKDFGIIDGFEKIDGIASEVNSQTLSEPIVVDEKEKNGRYEWVVQIPIEIVAANKKMKIDVQVIVVRSPRLESASGVGIEEVLFNNVRME
jgi:intracellular multiplication protein IcmL